MAVTEIEKQTSKTPVCDESACWEAFDFESISLKCFLCGDVSPRLLLAFKIPQFQPLPELTDDVISIFSIMAHWIVGMVR